MCLHRSIVPPRPFHLLESQPDICETGVILWKQACQYSQGALICSVISCCSVKGGNSKICQGKLCRSLPLMTSLCFPPRPCFGTPQLQCSFELPWPQSESLGLKMICWGAYVSLYLPFAPATSKVHCTLCTGVFLAIKHASKLLILTAKLLPYGSPSATRSRLGTQFVDPSG